MAEATATETRATPFERVGGADAVRVIVERFYDLMDADPAYAELRAMHASDLAPMRTSLAGFLNAWLGGPRDWFATPRKGCIMSLHAPLPITQATAVQWASAMKRAIDDAGLPDADIARAMAQALGQMAGNMARNAAVMHSASGTAGTAPAAGD